MESKAKGRGGARENAGRKTKHDGATTTMKVERGRKEVVERMRDMFYKYEKLEDEAVDEMIEMIENSGILKEKLINNA